MCFDMIVYENRTDGEWDIGSYKSLENSRYENRTDGEWDIGSYISLENSRYKIQQMFQWWKRGRGRWEASGGTNTKYIQTQRPSHE